MESIDFNPRHETIARDNCSPSPRARSDRTRHVHVTADEPDARGTVRRTRAGPSLSEHGPLLPVCELCKRHNRDAVAVPSL
ncbi:Hypothetical protein SMAX5B_011701 [Scophthalmus maximus]|uniref:Uncharacterized protein n=1 Tax=Scophthalmus maximus TaxID=52904 RepID=A0A2U9AYU3_SCOMX|nr:Hypothetical protein SMAX5B_011701 [Scophthalmus maximus]KAF0021719.1 hypothetical protein F2P81_026027 [Scophthalmus maximus]